MGSVVIAGRTIHYHAAGRPQPRTGHRVLYVHGTGCNGTVWGPHMAAIADVHEPVAIDLPGHGRSPGRGFRGVADYAHFQRKMVSESCGAAKTNPMPSSAVTTGKGDKMGTITAIHTRAAAPRTHLLRQNGNLTGSLFRQILRRIQRPCDTRPIRAISLGRERFRFQKALENRKDSPTHDLTVS
jgi:hypothetical protein